MIRFDAAPRHSAWMTMKPLLALGALALIAACSSNPTVTGPSTATAMGILSGSAQVDSVGVALSTPLVVHVTDQYANGMPGVTVSFVVTGGATLGNSTATTDSSGNAQTTVTFGTAAGIDTVVASVTGVLVPATFFETATAGAPATLTAILGNNQSGASGTVLPASLEVQVMDQHGNPVLGDTLSWTAATGTLSAPTSITNTAGAAQVQFTPALGANTVTASIARTALSAVFTETGN